MRIASMDGKLDRPSVKQHFDLAEFFIALALGFAFFIAALYFAIQIIGYPGDFHHHAGSRDFISYWASGKQLVDHANPYAPEAISALEHAEGLNVHDTLVMRNPPWALPFAYPLGFVGVRWGAILWSLLVLGCLFLSVRWVCQLYGDPAKTLRWLALSFTPALICFLTGQTSMFLLIGLVLFLRLHKTRPFAAGAALGLCALKPQFFLPFALVLLVWIVVTRSYRILAGGMTTMAACSLITTWIDPAAWSQYAYYVHHSSMTREFTGYPSELLRDSIHPAWEWLAFVPAILACIWALAWFWPRRHAWDWIEQGSLLMLVSLVVAPFGWIFDQSVAIPALVHGARTTRSRTVLAVLAIAILAMDVEFCLVRVPSPYWLWTTPAWLVWYLFARASSREQGAMPIPASLSASDTASR